jgi:hypothetical protein
LRRGWTRPGRWRRRCGGLGTSSWGADGRVTESIKWKTPTFAYQGNIASFNPSKHLLSIMFHRGAEIPGEHPRLEGDGRLVRTMRFADLAELEAGRADLEAAVRAWCDWKGGPATG